MKTSHLAALPTVQYLKIDKRPVNFSGDQPVDDFIQESSTSFRCSISKYPLLDCPKYKARVLRLNDGDYLMFRAIEGGGLLGTGATGRCHLGKSPTGQWLCIKEVSLFALPCKEKQEMSFNQEIQQRLRTFSQEEVVIANGIQSGLAPWFYLERTDGRKIYMISSLGAASLRDVDLVKWRNFVPPESLRQTVLQQLIDDHNQAYRKTYHSDDACQGDASLPLSVDKDAAKLVQGTKHRFQDLFPRNRQGKQWQGGAIWSLLRSITAELVQLHQRGILHNDIRGSNIMVGGEDSLPHLIDFNCTLNLHWKSPWDDAKVPKGAQLAERAPELAGSKIHGLYEVRQLRVRDWLKSDIYALAWTILELFRSGPATSSRIKGVNKTKLRRLHIYGGLLPEDIELVRYWELRGKNQTDEQSWLTLHPQDRQEINTYWENIAELPAPLPQILAQMMSVKPQDRPSALNLLKTLESRPILPPEGEPSWWHFYQPERKFHCGVDVFTHFEQVWSTLQQQQQLTIGVQIRLLAPEQHLIPMVAMPLQLNMLQQWRQGKSEKIIPMTEYRATDHSKLQNFASVMPCLLFHDTKDFSCGSCTTTVMTNMAISLLSRVSCCFLDPSECNN